MTTRRRAAAAALAALTLAAPSGAESIHGPTGPVGFAVPADGPVTLGVFDGSGRRIRTLHTLEPQESFQRGLNGLITSWDGLDDKGAPATSGKWFIRGFLMDGVMVEDQPTPATEWSADPAAPQPRAIIDFLLPGGDTAFLLLRTNGGDHVAARWSPREGFSWATTLDGNPSLLAAAGGFLIAAGEATWHLLDPRDGSTTASPPNPLGKMPAAIAGSGDSVVAIADGQLAAFRPPSLAPGPSSRLPTDVTALAASPGLKASASPSRLLVSTPPGDSWRSLDLPVTIDSLDIGPADTIWFSGRAMDPSSSPLVGQLALDGEVLRAMFTPVGDPVPARIRADRGTDAFGTLAANGAEQVLRLLRRDGNGNWVVEWEKSTPATAPPAFKSGPQTHRFRLAENEPTDPPADDWITLRALPTPEGTFLVTDDDLPVVHVTTTPDAARVGVARGGVPGSLVVTEGGDVRHLVTGLDRIIPLAVGGVETSQAPGTAPSAGRQNQPPVSMPVSRP